MQEQQALLSTWFQPNLVTDACIHHLMSLYRIHNHLLVGYRAKTQMDPQSALRAGASILPTFAYPNLSNAYDASMSGLAVVFMILAGIVNIFPTVPGLSLLARSGAFLSYSKFAHAASAQIPGLMVNSRVGMTLLYGPSALLALWFLQEKDFDMKLRPNVVAAMVATHFSKRTLECLFLHKYSGGMPLSTSCFISIFYCIATHGACHFARTVSHYEDWTYNVGGIFFMIGILGNFYHHYLLANLRKPGEKGYKVPQGGAFEYVAAPHYMFELLGWFGIVLVTQHMVTLLMFAAMAIYLADRSIGQDEWNRRKIPGYPIHRKCMVPFIF